MDRILALQNLVSFELETVPPPAKSTDSGICSTVSTGAVASSCSLVCTPEEGLNW
jgi:hypothetical protein